jgi:hypothetical protein
MLILSRNQNESIVIDGNIRILILKWLIKRVNVYDKRGPKNGVNLWSIALADQAKKKPLKPGL